MARTKDQNRRVQRNQPSARLIAKPQRKPTLRQLRFAQFFTDPSSPGFGNAAKSAELAGYSGMPGSNQLAVRGSEALNNPTLQHQLAKALEEQGTTVELAARRLREAMDATEQKVFLTKAGQLRYSKALPSNPIRLQALGLLFRLFGQLQLHPGQELPGRRLAGRIRPDDFDTIEGMNDEQLEKYIEDLWRRRAAQRETAAGQGVTGGPASAGEEEPA